MKTDTKLISTIIRELEKHYDVKYWWPHETKFEIMMGAILVQRTSWINVTKVLKKLRENDIFDAQKISCTEIKILEQHLKSSGFYKQKAKRLHDLSSLIVNEFNGRENNLFSLGLEEARKYLMSINGVGDETADTMLLYAGDMTTFIIDSYTKRLFSRLGIVKENIAYSKLKDTFEKALPKDLESFKSAHSVIISHCQKHCKKVPDCNHCPISKYCSMVKK